MIFISLMLHLAFSIEEKKEEKSETKTGARVEAKKIAEGFDLIWSVAFLNDSEILVAEKDGDLYRYSLQDKKRNKIEGMPKVLNEGQGGLMHVALHPNFSENQLIYFTYSYEEKGKANTRLARARLEKNDLSKFEILFTAKPLVKSDVHYGSRIAFDKKGHVFVSLGERGERHQSQSLSSHLGKIIRLREDGSIPSDNPFVKNDKAFKEIWSYGHRNPQGLYYDTEADELWSSEHGPRGGDEINLIKKGKNYGWPVVTHGREYYGPKIGEGNSKAGMVDPVKVYVPSIAPSSLHRYKSAKFPEWKNDFFLGALVLQHLNHVKMKQQQAIGEERYFENLGRIRFVTESPQGDLFFSTDSGEIYKVEK